ncbi:MAG: hypothetical protein Q8M02_09545 [Candidatus Didemnitutus sp.]|nr:hypothetical protein [Candidatus Didemnitutus sp.]
MEIGAIAWFWRGLRGHSVTFAVLFASFVLGASVAGGVGKLLTSLGVHWLYVVILPALLFRWLARKETTWLPVEKQRVVIARGVLLGSVVLAILINQIRH